MAALGRLCVSVRTAVSKAGSDATGVAGENSETRVRLASLENPAVRTDAHAMGRSGGTLDTAEQDTQIMRNLPNVLVVEPRYADPLSLVHYKKVLVTKAAIEQLKEMFA